LRSSFTRSRFVRLLEAGLPTPAEAPAPDFAERMSLWVDAFAAVRLQAAQQAARSLRAPAVVPRQRAAALAADVQRVRAALAAAIARKLTHDEAPAYAAYRQRHLELQHQMELMVAPLREHVRQALGRGSTRLRQLAALDAALDDVLAPREQKLLPAAAALLERRFGELALDVFERQWREVLLAEVDLRLERVTGLVEALSNEPELPS
jgi:hypothetical protein